MNITITASFKSSGNPQTGLSPTVTVWQVNGTNKTVVKTDMPMAELGNGIYSYVFDQFNALHDYLFLMDAGATSDSRYLESEWNGYKSLVDLIPRGGGVAMSPTDINNLLESLKRIIEDIFDSIEIEVPETDTTQINDTLEKAVKEFKLTTDKEQKALLSLIDKASNKVDEVKNPTIITETVNTKDMEERLVREAAKAVEAQGANNIDDMQETMVDFIKLLRKEFETTRDSIREEERERADKELVNIINKSRQ